MTSPDSPSPAIAPLVAQIKSGTAVDREQAAAALWSLAWNDANRVAIAEDLVTLVTHGAAGGQCSAAARCGGCRKNKTSVQRGKYLSGAQGRGAGAAVSSQALECRRTSGNILVERGALSPERGV